MLALAASFLRDARFAVRTLRARPAFALVALLTLALGIGANTAVYSVVHGVLLSPLPYRDPGRLVGVWPAHFGSNGELEFLQRHARAFDGGVAAFSPGWGISWSRPGGALQLNGARTSTNFFRVLGARPVLGRGFVDGESAAGRDHVVLLSHELWTTAFGADARAVGATMVLDGEPYTVVGVMPPATRIFQADAELWLPLQIDPASPFYTGGTAHFVGRLRAGVTRAAALAELRSLVPPMRSALGYEAAYGRDVDVVPLRDQVVGALRAPLLVLLGAVGFIVLIAASNVGNLLLARAAERRGEIATRVAIGATRARVVRQLLGESAVLAAGGGALGVALGAAGLRALVRLLPADTPRLESVALDVPVLVVCAGVTLAVGLLCGVAPAVVATHPDLRRVARGARGEAGSVAARRARGALVVAEVGLALVLVIGAALMLQTLWRLTHVDAGFRTANVLTLRVQPTGDAYGTREQRAAYYARVLDRLRAEPGVVTVGALHHLPLTGFDWHNDVEIEGQPAAPGATPFRPGFRTALGDYFGTMRVPLLAGRVFDARDDMRAEPVAIVSDAFASARFGSAAAAVGKRLRAQRATRDAWARIVGVVGSVRHVSLAEAPEPEFYLAASQFPQGATAIVIRTADDPRRAARRLHAVVASLDRGVPISDVRPADDLVVTSLAQQRVVMTLLLAFAVVGLALGAIGIYGVVSYAVARRTREIGVRVALGAGRAAVMRGVLGEGLAYASGGIALGLVAAAALTRAMRTLVYGVSPTDPLTFGALALLLAVVACAASWIPARRAARMDPVAALRAE
ncbi:permease (plasmid) [Gemmatirosa kalamazoonensis]|uniref:Permease n=1 Tax=Gemmatirosa kalamazoonensis TaxID=861299 RepID=W0RU29_9BACT|nr:ABC transporter permease [Gemmatirosa kalamazoonensis]AHG93098.1 permease [Gemmatirosa kalamazoonensis]